jgi:hypothetical protein
MALSEAELEALRTFPESTLQEVPRTTVAALNDEYIARLKGVPYDMSALVGNVAMVRADGESLDVAGNTPGSLIGFGGQAVWQWIPRVISVTGSTIISDANHRGALLKCGNVSAITLTFAIGGSGISDNFTCYVARLRFSGAVQIARGGGVTNGHANDHTRISAGGAAQLWLAGTELAFYGATEA